jgi:NADH:ubiquinone oxidoreductase subunit 6 (subunit J)
MLNAKQNSIALGTIRITQVIAAAMTMGALFFAGTMAIMVVDWNELGGPVKLMSTLAAASTIIFFGLAVVIPSMFPTLPAKIERSEDEGVQNRAVTEIGKLLTSQTVVRFALLEACVFANVLPLMFEPRWINVIAAGVGVLLMLAFFPMTFRQLAKIEQRFGEWQSGIH